MSATFDSVSLKALTAPRKGPCVSIYVPLQLGGSGTASRLARLLETAEGELVQSGLAGDEAAAVIAQAREAADQIDVAGAVGNQTLALFAAPGFARAFRDRLSTAESVTVGPRFHFRPLLPLLAAPDRYYVLAVSLNHVRLLEVDRGAPRRLSVGSLASGFAAMGYEYEAELQVHSAGVAAGHASHRTSVVHGHGDGGEHGGEEDLRHFFKRIADAVAALPLDGQAPRVLATTRDHAAMYLGVSRDRMLLAETVHGSPDRLSDGELALRAKELVEAARERERLDRLTDWRELLGTPRATGDLATVLRMAAQKRVQTLFLPVDGELWGRFDDATGGVELHVERQRGDEELLERAAIDTLAGGGAVYEMQHAAALDGAPLAAVLRR
jgi:hypothetical protein